MMKNSNYLLLIIFSLIITSCTTAKEVRYLQPNESLVINEEGLIPYNIPVYRVTKNDILKLNIVTTPKGDAAQFYSTLNVQEGSGITAGVSGGNGAAGNVLFYYNGLRVESNGEINIFGIGYIKAEGRTLEEISKEIQLRINENFVEGKSEARLFTSGITYYILGDVETVGITGEKTAHKSALTLTEAISSNGGLNRSIDRKNITIYRKLPEGIKKAVVDLTREDAMNSPFFYVQNGDEIFLTTQKKSLNGFGKDAVQTLTTGVSVLTTALSIYLILSRL